MVISLPTDGFMALAQRNDREPCEWSTHWQTGQRIDVESKAIPSNHRHLTPLTHFDPGSTRAFFAPPSVRTRSRAHSPTNRRPGSTDRTRGMLSPCRSLSSAIRMGRCTRGWPLLSGALRHRHRGEQYWRQWGRRHPRLLPMLGHPRRCCSVADPRSATIDRG